MTNLLEEKIVGPLNAFKKLNKIDSPQSAEEIANRFKIFEELNVNREFLNLNTEGSIEIPGSSHRECIGLNKLISVANKLHDLKGSKGFQTLSDGFNNPEQFSATIFEVECAHHSSRAFSAKSIEFSREFEVNGGKKFPDFVLQLPDDSLLVCECKSLESLNRAKQSRALRLMKEVEPEIVAKLPSGTRAEIAFKSLPQHWNRNYGEQLAAALGELVKVKRFDNHLEFNFDGKQLTWLRLGKLGEAPYFKCTLNVGNKPPKNNPTLIVGEQTNLKSDIKDTIRDALTQLPSDKLSAIFVYSLNEHFAKEATTEYFRDNNVPSLVCVMSWTDNVRAHQNPRCSLQIEKIYRP